MTRALFEAGIKPDLLIGTSAGAINASFLATHPGADAVDELADVWRSLKRSTVFPARASGFLGLLGKRNYLCKPDPLRSLLARHLGMQTFADTKVKLRVVATDLTTGHEVVLRSGNIVKAVMASASLPGILPPVEIDGRQLIDGAVINNAPLSEAVRAGADDVYLLVCGHTCAPASPPSNAVATILQAVSVLIGRQLVMDVDRYEPQCNLHVVPQVCPQDVLPMDFSQAERLIQRGYEHAAHWLSAPQPLSGQARTIEPHQH